MILIPIIIISVIIIIIIIYIKNRDNYNNTVIIRRNVDLDTRLNILTTLFPLVLLFCPNGINGCANAKTIAETAKTRHNNTNKSFSFCFDLFCSCNCCKKRMSLNTIFL